ncbi:MAG TPA: NmrA family NAD(P)-binding protein [Anaerolineaceae bacterium]|nr:NmrA family NAD(P)-binding protein [Anaerolineaceae bacterium]
MILVTGATGFIGRALTRQLVESGHNVRILLRPSPYTPRLPTGVPVEVAVTSLDDVRGLRAAMHGVDVVFHLAGGESEGGRANLQAVDIDGTRNLAEAAVDAGVQRIFYISHLGADRASAFPVFKAKGIAEEYLRKSGIPYTIVRGSILFGPQDTFTSGLAMMLAIAPGFIPLPGKGDTLLQPLWVEDLSTCLAWALEEPSTINQTYEVGGSEYFTLRQVMELVMQVSGRRRLLVSWPTPLMRALTVVLESVFPRFPISVFWLDYMAVNRTCPVDTVARVFGLMPARFASRLDYLRGVHWGREALRTLFIRHA